jgi:uncharacterized membrane protein
MAEFPTPDASRAVVATPALPTGAALAIYVLYGIAALASLFGHGLPIAPLFGVIGFIGVVIAYVKRDEARGTWLDSHFRWLIRTFWYGLLWAVVGWLLIALLVGLLISPVIWIAASLWILYRVIRGFLRFGKQEPMPVM